MGVYDEIVTGLRYVERDGKLILQMQNGYLTDDSDGRFYIKNNRGWGDVEVTDEVDY